jgi:hypothetical protein
MKEAIAKPNTGTLSTIDGGPNAITALIQTAIEKDIDAESLQKLVDVLERVTDRNAAQSFNAALAGFQSECPVIPKNKTASFPTKSGGRMEYSYAPLDTIVKIVRPIAHEHGLSFAWNTATEDKQLSSTCTLRHVDGHASTATATVPIDGVAKMSAQQQSGAAMQYAMRYSLIQVLGITTAEDDTDGKEPSPPISKSQAANLECLIDEVKADRGKFLGWMQVESVSDITADRLRTAIQALERKRGDK